jgi:hypothetical protein
MERLVAPYAGGPCVNAGANGQLDGAKALHIGAGVHLTHSTRLDLRNKKSYWAALCRWQWFLSAPIHHDGSVTHGLDRYTGRESAIAGMQSEVTGLRPYPGGLEQGT